MLIKPTILNSLCLNFYWSYADLNDMINLTEQMVEFIALKVNGSTKINYQGTEIDVKAP